MASSKTAIYAALVGNFCIAVTKFAAAAFTGSSAMLSEGIHSLVDTGNQVLLLYGLKRSQRPSDERFPFGHGKEVYFWSFVVAILIFAVGAGLSLYEGILHILHPTKLERPMINYLVLGLGLVFEGAAWGLAFKAFRRTKDGLTVFEAVRRSKDPSLFVVLFEDSAAMLGLCVAALGIFLTQVTGNPVFDGAASVCIGVILGGTAIWLAYETKGLLIGESANLRVVRGIRELARTFPGVKHVNEVLTLHMGPEFILVNLSIDFEDTAVTTEVETMISRLDKAIKHTFPLVKRVFIEAEARRPHHLTPEELEG